MNLVQHLSDAVLGVGACVFIAKLVWANPFLVAGDEEAMNEVETFRNDNKVRSFNFFLYAAMYTAALLQTEVRDFPMMIALAVLIVIMTVYDFGTGLFIKKQKEPKAEAKPESFISILLSLF